MIECAEVDGDSTGRMSRPCAPMGAGSESDPQADAERGACADVRWRIACGGRVAGVFGGPGHSRSRPRRSELG